MKTRRYLIEFFIIFFSVMLAFLAEDYREQRQDEEDYQFILNEIESNIALDSVEFDNKINYLKVELEVIKRLLDSSVTLSIDSIQFYLSALTIHGWAEYKSTGISQLRNSKTIEVKSPAILKINELYTWLEYYKESQDEYFRDTYSNYNKFLVDNFIPPTGFKIEADDSIRIHQLLRSPALRSHLQHIYFIKDRQAILFTSTLSRLTSTLYLLRNPEYLDKLDMIGIIGPATGNDWILDTFLEEGEEGVWKIEMELEDGFVKFRRGADWAINWGGTMFPNGIGVLYGPNIPIEKGRYNITFNENTGEYWFELIP